MTNWTPEAEAQARTAAQRVDDWDGADHFEDCKALPHVDHECDCSDTPEGEDVCANLAESECDCYLGAMRDCQRAIAAALRRIGELEAEMEKLKRGQRADSRLSREITRSIVSLRQELAQAEDEANFMRGQYNEAEEKRGAAEAQLARVVEALGTVICPSCEEVFMVTVPKDALAAVQDASPEPEK